MKTTKKQPAKDVFTVKLEFEDKSEAFNLAYNIVSLCQATSFLIAENDMPTHSAREREEILGASEFDVANGLRFVKNLLVNEIF